MSTDEYAALCCGHMCRIFRIGYLYSQGLPYCLFKSELGPAIGITRPKLEGLSQLPRQRGTVLALVW